jgi:hypothetical protein
LRKGVDINRLSIADLHKLLHGETATTGSKEVEKAIRLGAKVVGGDSTYKIIRLETPEQAMAASEDTQWCTRGSNMAKKYTSEGPLFVVLKNGERLALIHLASKQVKDVYDHPLSNEEGKHLEPFLDIMEVKSQGKELENLFNKATRHLKLKSGYEVWRNEKGELHREDGPAIEYADGGKEWRKNGKLHHDDGPALIDADGNKYWYKDGKLYRDDGPVIEYTDGTKKWYKNGKLHRDNGPALIDVDGNKEWYKDGQRHRDDGPAIEYADGNKEWYKNDLRHREDGPAVERSNGDKEWWKNDQLHRDDGPAIEYVNVKKAWYKNGKLHRDDGPAIEKADGTKEWWKNGQRVPEPKRKNST